jgi:membrane-associated phospholipid phosphatase
MKTDRARLLSTALTSAILPLALLAAVMISLGFLTTHVLVHVWPFTIEREAVRALVAARTPALDRISDWVSQIAYIAGLIIAWVVAGGIMRIAYHRWREALFLAAAVLSQLVVYVLTSRIVTRARPPVPRLDHFNPIRSWPSGHVAAALALYGGIAVILAMRSRHNGRAVAWWALFLVVPIAVGLSRMYRGMHYPSDVVGGFIIGFGCLWILQRAMLTPARQRGSVAS